MKTVIYVWKNNSIHRSKKCDDLFQLIKTTCYLYYLSTVIPFKLYIDTFHHSISTCLLPIPHPYQTLISNHIHEIPIVHDLDYYIMSTSSPVYLCSTTYLYTPLTSECKYYIQQLIRPTYPLLQRLEPIKVNDIVHVHINTPIISTATYTHLYYIIYNKIKPYLYPTTIVVSDTQEFKNYLRKKECIVFDTKIGNIGYPPHDNRIEDTLFDLYLLSKATKIYSFSWENKIPGFLNILDMYDIPIVKIKN